MAFLKHVALFMLTSIVAAATSDTSMLRPVNSHGVRLPRMLNYETVDTAETYYSEYAQAWRMLGLYMDCEGQEDGTSICQRYLLWAAYIDEEYSGFGEGEYMFYNSETGKWDDSACSLAGSSRCVRMDCHLPNTHFKLLGYYKQYGVNDFFEQLFAHQGSCAWSEDEYYFMENSRDAWPEDCTQSAVTDENGAYVYYHIKPLSGGRMTIGLYYDAQCSITYTGSLTLEEAIRVDDENDDAYKSNVGTDEWIDKWNKALETYKTCQPCKVSSLSNGARRRRRRLDEEGEGDDVAENEEDQQEEQADDDDGLFTCQDAAGYQGANQCALFAMNTDVEPATFRDVRLGTLQGTIVRTHAAGATSSRFQKWWRAWGFFTLSMLIFLIGMVFFCCFVKVKKRIYYSPANEPLLSTSNKSHNSTSSKNTSKTSKSGSRNK